MLPSWSFHLFQFLSKCYFNHINLDTLCFYSYSVQNIFYASCDSSLTCGSFRCNEENKLVLTAKNCCEAVKGPW